MLRLFRASSNTLVVAATVLVGGCADRVTSPSDPGPVSFSMLPGGTSFGGVSAGGYHTCAVKTDGAVMCWGNLGQGLIATTVPPSATSISQISSGGLYTCGLKTDGTVLCWGESSSGQLAVPASATSVTQLATGYYHVCALRSDATVVCWGDNSQNQSTVPAEAASIVQVSAGGYHTCALKSDGTVLCWGYNGTGQIAVPASATSVTQVAAGFVHTCALRMDGTVVCWGNNTEGQTDVPAAATSVTQITGGQYHTCALKTDGTVICWGSGPQGQITVPASATSVNQVTAGLLHTCAGKTDGTVVCWGYNGNGQTNVPGGLNLITTQPQAISFTSTPSSAAIVGGSYAVTATGGGSGNPVTFSSLTSTTCSVTGATVAFLTTGTCTVAADQAGNASYFPALQVTQSLTIGKAPQVITFTTSPADPAVLGSVYLVAASSSIGAPVSFTTSGSCSNSGAAVQLAAIGSCSVTAHAAGNADYLDANGPTQTIAVVFAFAGFFSPVSNLPETNTANSGQTVQVTFSLSGDQGLAIFAAGSPASVPISCATLDSDGPTVPAAGPGLSELTYNASQDQYKYNWKTEKDWAGTCRQFLLTLNDGTTHLANFWFVK